MLSFADAPSILAGPTHAPNDPVLQRLLAERIHDWAATDLLGLTHLLIVEADDREQDLLNEIAYSPLVNPIDGVRFPSPDYVPPFYWLERHDGWFELIQTVANDGFAFVIFIHADEGDPELLSLCQTYTRAEQPA
jgi:hypothetical protein